jgi:hypothetical protein
MANIAKYLGNQGAFSNEKKIAKCVLDYTADGGATGFYPAFVAGEDILIHKVVGKVKTAVTGSGTVSFGISSSTTNMILARASADLTANAVVSGVIAIGSGLRVASGASVGFDIASAVISAGKIEVEVEYTQF